MALGGSRIPAAGVAGIPPWHMPLFPPTLQFVVASGGLVCVAPLAWPWSQTKPPSKHVGMSRISVVAEQAKTA
eukprot:1988413-Lingulodinium_polyedra.AAC.1